LTLSSQSVIGRRQISHRNSSIGNCLRAAPP
jgi:hypothetical protein